MGGRRSRFAEKNAIDGILLLVTAVLIIVGIIMIFSSSAIMAHEKYRNMYFFVFRQLMWGAFGTAAMVTGMNVDYRIWAKYSRAAMIVVLLLLASVLLPFIGHSVGGARRWLRFGGMGFQPAELAKIVIVIYMASILDRKFSKIKTFYRDLFFPLSMILVMVLMIYKQPDFGTSVIIIALVGSMLFMGGVRVRHLGIGLLMFIPFIVYAMFSFGYRRERMLAFLKPFENMYDTGFQLAHSLVALGDGGLRGVGLGAGYQKLFFIPEVHTDFVFAVIGQELGFLGTLGVLLLFALFTWRGMRIALKHREYLGRIMAAGITFLISIQVIINIGVVTGCLPTKGLSLPFVSFGGSSLFFNMFAVGVLLNISRESRV